jgi:hypothetical protein
MAPQTRNIAISQQTMKPIKIIFGPSNLENRLRSQHSPAISITNFSLSTV